MPSDRQPFRFGIFEVNLETGDLRRAGSKVKLQEQPFQVLAALLEKPGEIVTKEELQERIWKDDTFVDFDRSLATAINKVRQALGDSATRPRYVETVAKRGYRFIGLNGQVDPDLDNSRVASARMLAPTERAIPRSKLLALQLLAVSLGVAFLAVLAVQLTETTMERPVRRFSFPVENIAFRSGGIISPNGKYILYGAGNGASRRLWLRSLEEDSTRKLEETAGAISAFWSPDSLSIGFGTNSELKRMSLNGPPQTLCALPSTPTYPFLGGTWSPDGERIVFSSGLRLFEVASRGGEPELLFDPGDNTRRYFEDPHFLPTRSQTQALAYTATASPSDRMLAVMNMGTGERRELVPGAAPVYSPHGFLIYGASDRTDPRLRALPFSIDSLAATGESFPITEGGQMASVARDGTLSYLDRPMDILVGTLVWRNRTGELLEIVGEPQLQMRHPALSPDGQQVAVSSDESGNMDIWIYDLVRSTKTRLTFDDRPESYPSWSPSGQEIVYRQGRSGEEILMRKAANGSGDAVVLFQSEAAVPDGVAGGSHWSPDGRSIVWTARKAGIGADVFYLRFATEGSTTEPVALLGTAARERGARVAPDGRFVAYVSDESGRNEVYVRPFPAGAGKRQVSANGGNAPRWRSDGQELFYVEGTALMSLSVSTGEGLTLGRPQKLFGSEELVSIARDLVYSVSANGQRFLFVETAQLGEPEPPHIRIIQNWYEEFREPGR